MSKDYIFSGQLPMFGGRREIIGFGSDKLNVTEISRDLANKIIVDNHYSKKYYNASFIHLGLFSDAKLVGVLQFGYAMNPASQDSVVSGTEITEYLELNRMWLSDEMPRNSESMAISYSIKYIRGKFKRIKWIQSFADERCNRFGVVYQAANFKYYGEHNSIFWIVGEQIFHNSLMTRDPKLSKAAAFIQKNKGDAKSVELRQFRYLYFIDRRSISKCNLTEKPFPKHGSAQLAQPDQLTEANRKASV